MQRGSDHRFFSSFVLTGAGFVVACVLAWILGQRAGSASATIQQRDLNEAQLQPLLHSQSQLRQQLELASLERGVAEAALLELQQTMLQQQQRSLADESELRLYRRIAGDSGRAGLAVDTVVLVNDHAMLEITLMQIRGRHKIAGSLAIALVGERAGKAHREVLVGAGADALLSFNLRFFQTLTAAMPAQGMLIDLVEIDVQPDAKGQKSFQHVVAWDEIQRR